MLGKGIPAGARETVGAAAIIARQRLDQAVRLEPRQRSVERPRTEFDARELLDVLDIA